MSDTDLVIQTRNLTRYFGSRHAVYDLNLAVPRGAVFGFLGRNGSGKTTTIRMLLGLLDPTRGSATVLGHDSRSLPPELRARIGYLAEGHPVYGWMTVAQSGDFQSRFYPTWNQRTFDSIIDYFRLSPATRARDLSRGQRAGLALAMVLAPDPELLILDDPAMGLDPVARRSLLESMLYVTRKSDRTILFSTHLLSDVERVADYIAVLDQSILRAQCPLETFRSRVRQYVLNYAGRPPQTPAIPGLLQAMRLDDQVRLTIANADDKTIEKLRALDAASVTEVPISLEDAFIAYLGDRGEKTLLMSNAEDHALVEDAA